MKTNRRRHDDETQTLFKHEKALRRAFQDDDWNAVEGVLKELRHELKTQRKSGIASSRGLDHFVQVAMAWITTYLGWRAQEHSFRATVSLFLPNLQAVLVKPSLVAPDKSRAPQPTISTDKKSPNFGYRGAIGHTGLVMISEKILYCQPIVTRCGHYIALESGKSKAALCIPLKGQFSELLEEFKREQDDRTIDTCSLHGQCEATSSQIDLVKEDKIVLNVECVSDFLSLGMARKLMSEAAFEELIQEIIDTLADYQKQRDMHRALEHSSTLLALATNTLRPRDAYRALLREISTACDGADVTLHLQDLFDGENEHRCSLFVTGIGKNFRDFLINERIGLNSGQIGWALAKSSDAPPGMSESAFDINIRGDNGSQTVPVYFVAGDEITKSLAEENDIPFKQLMPNTFLNVTVPIYFDDIKIGVLNLEWDKKTLDEDAGLGPLPQTIGARARELIRQYLSQCLPVVYRMADYLSLVIDYFDDVQNLIGRPKPEQLDDPEYIDRLERDGALRKVMRYYMKRGMAKARTLADESGSTLNENANAKFLAEAKCLEDLVDAMGYFLAHISDLRILVSVRRKTLDKHGSWILSHQVSHWLEGDQRDKDAKESPIGINDPKSVLAACARHGVPLFGSIEKMEALEDDGSPKRQLRLDDRCRELIRDSQFPERPETVVPYRRAGNEPRYEVGVPLVFGRSLLGTFDFEQFEQDKPTTDPRALQDHDLCAHLEWSRAIAFLLGYFGDEVSPITESKSRQKTFRRFQALTAQLIAEVPVDEDQFLAIATDSFAEIFPVKNAHVKTLRKIYPQTQGATGVEVSIADDGPAQVEAPIQNGEAPQMDLLRFRGVAENALTWEKDESKKGALLRSQSELKPRSTMTSMMTAYHSLIRNLRQDPEEVEFNAAIDRIILDFARAKKHLTDPSRDAGEAVLNAFLFLHKSLRRNLASLADEIEAGPRESEYAWFLHVRRFEPGEVLASFNCDVAALDEGKQVLAYCYTSEMREIVEQIRRLTNDRSPAELLKAIETVLKVRSKDIPIQDPILRVKAALPGDGPVGEQDLIRALTICLARRRVVEDGALSFTLSVANAGGALVVVPEMKFSPTRSERGHGWFWRSTYTVLGIPFMFDNQCVAVLNIFRRRDSNRDMKFFRIEERDKAKELVNSVSELLKELVNTEQVNPIDKVRLREGLNPLVNSLIRRAGRDAAKLIVVKTPFATSAASFQVLYDVIFANENVPAQLTNAVRFPEDELSIQNRNVVVRIGKKIVDPEKLGADIGLLTERANRVFLFTCRRQDLTQGASEPVYARHVPIGDVDETLLNEDSQQEELYRDWLLGKAIVSSEGDQLKMLFRCAEANQEWTYQAFTKWLLDRRRDSETADFYELIDLLRASSWRPDDKTLALNRWPVAAREKGARQ